MITFEHILIDNCITLRECIKRIANETDVVAGAFDTETTGLHPTLDKPFLFQCGYYKTDLTGVVFIIDLERTPQCVRPWLNAWYSFAACLPIYLGHHVVFDLHMLTNAGYPYTHYDNLSDTQFYIRASSDAVQESEGGEPLALKAWAKRHISKDAADWEKDLKLERIAQAKAYNSTLLERTGWKKGEFNEFFKDKVNDWTDLPLSIREIYLQWKSELPEYLQGIEGLVDSEDIQYNYLNREKVIEYGYKDIEYTLLCYYLCSPVLDVRCNHEQVRRENEQIPCIYQMERVGFLVDREYLQTCKARTKEYIRQRRKDLCVLAGEELSCQQNARIKTLLEQRYGVEVQGTGQEILEQECKHLGDNPDAQEFINTILELRTLEKWYSTYICKFTRQLQKSNRIYTSIHQVGTVSGRVSCDFQQFPKAGLQDIEGNDLFDPRRMVITDEEYPAIVYLDYSAMELRLQALFTLLIGHPDYNMLRAYSPYMCHRADGTQYDPYTHADQAYDGTWLNDDGTPWEPTDLHGVMTETIFHIDKSDPRFHDLRYVGKRTNFAKNYGASYTRIREMFPEFDDDTCHKIDEAYYKSFPGVKQYHQWCFQLANEPYATNLYDVKYYGVSGHKLRNVMVQGSGAYLMKERITKVYEYLATHNCKTKVCMQIHDELQFYWHKDDPIDIFFDLQKIMADIGSPVPITSDMEVTAATWKDKKEVTTIEEFRDVITNQRPSLCGRC